MKKNRIDSRKIFTASFLVVLMFAVYLFAQEGGGLQEKLAAVKQAAAANQQALHQYQWTETTQISLKGEVKNRKMELCKYAPNGQVQKTEIEGTQPQSPQGGRLKEKMIEKKKDEMTQYMESAKNLIGQYVPPDPNRMQQAFQAGNVSINPSAASGIAELVFKNYVLPGDSMSLSFNSSTKKMTNLNVNTYMNDPKDAITLKVSFDSLPDGTSYPSQTVLVAVAKQIQVMTTNSSYKQSRAVDSSSIVK